MPSRGHRSHTKSKEKQEGIFNSKQADKVTIYISIKRPLKMAAMTYICLWI